MTAHALAACLVAFGCSVSDILQSVDATVDRDLDVVDLFCGAGAIHQAAEAEGLQAQDMTHIAFQAALTRRVMRAQKT